MPRLLLVEDEQVNRDLFRRRLERKGYTVVPAESGLQAVALTKSEKPDLVLMDLGLPDIDGWEATRRIKADATTAEIPVIVLSAHATTEARQKAFAAGCEEFETKPVNWEAVFKKIEESLKKAEERAKAKAAPPPPPPVAAAPEDDDEIDFGGSPADGPDPAAATGVLQSGKNKASAAKDTEKELCAVHPKRILVAEDNDANRVMLCRRLNKHGYATTEAADGRQALDAVAKQRFDLVLCDIMMPGVDGYEVLKEMKADPDLQVIPIIMISALDEMASIVRCIEMGAEDYLQKPYDPVLLHARINACLDKRRLRDQELDYLRAVADLTKAAEAVEKGGFDLAMLSVVAERDDALGTLARVFANMAYEVKARVQQLRNDVQKLVAVEVDHREIVQEVTRVTATEAFDKARRQADEARARRHRPNQPNPGAETMILQKPKPR
jgi:two-component system cell cycle response regulator